jgi:DNA-binding IclR family transcriptional regulator
MGKTPMTDDRYLVPGLMRGLAVLDAFTPERREMSLGEVAQVLGISRSAAFRTVYTLCTLGYLLSDQRRQTYTLGPAVLRLGHGYLATRELVEVALPELERLRDETDWSAHLGVRDGRTVLYLLRIPSRMGLGSIVHVGSRLPAATTTMGRVLLTELDEPGLSAVYRDMDSGGPVAVVSRSLSEILSQWRRDRTTNVVVQLGSFERGVAAVAAPVRDLSGSIVAAINLTSALPEGVAVNDTIIEAVRKAADRISRLLGRA